MPRDKSRGQLVGPTSGPPYIEHCFHGAMYPKQTVLAPIASSYEGKPLIQVATDELRHVTIDTANQDWIMFTIF